MATLDTGHEHVGGRRGRERRQGKKIGLRTWIASLAALGVASVAGDELKRREGMNVFDPSTWSLEGAAAARARAVTEASNNGEGERAEAQARRAAGQREFVSLEGIPYHEALLEELKQNPGIVNQPENAVGARRLSGAGGYSVLLPDGSSVLVRDINAPLAPMRSLQETMD